MEKIKNIDKAKLYIQVDVEGYITGVAQEPFEGHMETDLTMDEFMEKYGFENVTDGTHKYLDGEIVSDEGTERSVLAYYETVKSELRSIREQECFSIVNRGQVWYDTLTAEQRQELSVWYLAWLNVTETLEIPQKPSWLKP